MKMKKIVKSLLALVFRIRIYFWIGKNNCNNISNPREKLIKKHNYLPYDLSQKVLPLVSYNYDLSLIVPVYNASNYIEECIVSLLQQKTKYNYEIICVDDGSTDDSLLKLNKYRDKIKIIHQENGGISVARNTGLSASTGKYVGFIDNDDYVTSDYVEKLLECAFLVDADYVKCGFKIVDDVTKKEVEEIKYKDEVLKDFKNYNDFDNWLKGYMWGGCYKRTTWENFCFPAGYWYEDMIKNMYIYNKCQILASISNIMYVKRKHSSNASVSVWKKESKKCLDHLFLAEQLISMRGYANDLVYKATISELGEYLYKRIEYLDRETKIQAFLVASDLLEPRDIHFNMYERRILESFAIKDFKLWTLLGEYSKYK